MSDAHSAGTNLQRWNGLKEISRRILHFRLHVPMKCPYGRRPSHIRTASNSVCRDVRAESTSHSTMRQAARVCSVLPSATEVLCAIGGEKLLVGRSHEDNYPQSITDRPILTGAKIAHYTSAGDVDRQVSEAMAEGQSLYTLDEPLLQSLNPSVILTQDVCAVCAIDLGTVQRVATRVFPKPKVVSLNPQSLQDVLDDFILVGESVDMLDESKTAKERYEARIARATACVPKDKPPVKVAFIEWSDPVYVGGHWTPQLITMAGGYHTLNPSNEGADGLYVQTGGAGKSFPVPPEKVLESDPDVVIICPCGLNLQAAKDEADKLYETYWFPELRAVKAGRVYVVDGDAMFNRPGPRLVDALEWLVSLLQNKPEMCPADFPVEHYPSTSHRPQRVEDLARDIEDIHLAACNAGDATYKDPATGYTVITAEGHRKRGYCCGHRCRHCPYGHFNVKPGNRANTLTMPTLLRCPKNAQKKGEPVDVLFWSGGKDSFLTYAQHDGARKLVLLTTYAEKSGVIAHQQVHHHAIMDHAKVMGVDLVLVPLPEHNSDEEYLRLCREGIQLAAQGADDVRLLFGDLHLTDLKSWRERHFAPYSCVFPLFNTPYEQLHATLFARGDVALEVSASTVPEVAVGDTFDAAFVARLPAHVDAMGEKGEFHTKVTLVRQQA